MPAFSVPVQGQGIDVSKFQGRINWRKVARSGMAKFVYIKATEGTSNRDPYYKANVDSARAAGLLVGSYHVYSSKTTAYQQFDNFKSVVVKKKQDLIPVLDIEGHHSGRLNMARVDKILELMENHYGVKPMIYTSETLYKQHFSGKKYRAYHIFVAKYKGTPSVRYTLWQYSEKGQVPGIAGKVDRDRFHPSHSLADLYMPACRKNQEEAAAKTQREKAAADSLAALKSKADTVADTARSLKKM